MFCGNCGAKIEDGSLFCGECGAKVNGAPAAAPSPAVVPTTATASTTTNATNAQHKKIGIIAVAAIAVIVVLFLLFGMGSGSGSPKAAAEKFMKGFLEADGVAILDSLPDEVVDLLLEDGDLTKKEVAKELSKTAGQAFEYFDTYLGDWSIDYEIEDVDDVTKKEMKNLLEDYEELDIDIKDAKKVSIELTISSDLYNDSNVQTIYVIKVGGSWYVDMSSMENMF